MADDRTRGGGTRGVAAGAYLLTFLTGGSALVYEIVWQRYLHQLLGSDGLATATVLGVFLAGLSAGYFICGRLSASSSNLFRDYGRLELVVGSWALLFPGLFRLVQSASLSWQPRTDAGQLLQGVVLGTLLMAVPTLCMGATVPMLTRALSTSVQRATAVQARVYGLNALGACLGTLLAAQLLVPRMGLIGAVHAAAAPNVAAGIWFLWMARRPDSPAAAAGRSRPQRRHPAARSVRSVRSVTLIAFLSGFAFLTLETAVIRVGYLSLGGSAHTLALVLAVFVACVAAGALVVARLGAPGRSALFFNQALVALSTLALFVTLDEWPYWAHLLRIRIASSETGYWVHQGASFVALLALLAIPIGGMGATMPLAFHVARRGRGDLDSLGRLVGSLFGWNALGNLLGGVLGGYLLYRWMGIGEAIMLALACIGCSVLLAAAGLGRRERVAGWVVAALSIAGIVAYPGHDPLRFAAGTFRLREALEYSGAGPGRFYDEYYRGRRVLAYRDDPEATFAVIENPVPALALAERFPHLAGSIYANPSFELDATLRPRAIMINGKADSNTHFDLDTLLLLAHAPAGFATSRERVLVIGLGTGVTAGAISLYDDVKRIDIVEIAPAVVELLPHFAAANHGIADDPRIEILVADAFQVLRRGSARWDLIVSQPSNPWALGNDQLFSRDYFRLVRARLADGGVFAHWVQRYSTSEEIAAIAINTLRSEFEFVRVFRAGADDLLVASAARLDDETLARSTRRLSDNDAVRASLRSIGIDGVAGLLAREHPEVLVLAQARRSAGLETLRRPRLHHLASRAFFIGLPLPEPADADDAPSASGYDRFRTGAVEPPVELPESDEPEP